MEDVSTATLLAASTDLSMSAPRAPPIRPAERLNRIRTALQRVVDRQLVALRRTVATGLQRLGVRLEVTRSHAEPHQRQPRRHRRSATTGRPRSAPRSTPGQPTYSPWPRGGARPAMSSRDGQEAEQRRSPRHGRNAPKADEQLMAQCANSRSSSGLVMTRLSRTNSDFGTCLTSTQCDLMCAGTLHGPAKSVQNSDVSVLLSSRLFARLNREVHRNNRDHCQDDHVDRNRPGLRLELRHQPGGDQRRQGAREN